MGKRKHCLEGVWISLLGKTRGRMGVKQLRRVDGIFLTLAHLFPFKIFISLFIFMCVGVSPVCLWTTHVQYLRRPEEAGKPPGLELKVATPVLLNLLPNAVNRVSSSCCSDPQP